MAAVDNISALGTKALPALFKLLDESDPNKRWWAIRVLSAIPDPEVPETQASSQRSGLHHTAMRSFRSEPAAKCEYHPGFDTDVKCQDRLVARLSADALIAIGGPAVTDLIEILENGPQSSQVKSARALAVIGDTRAIPAMFAAWEDGSALIRHWIEQGFERMGVGMQFFKPE